MANQDYSFTTTGSGLGTLTISIVTSDGEMLQVQEGSPNFRKLYDALIEGLPEAEIIALARPILHVGSTLRRLSERIGFDGFNITFDGDIINNNLSRQLVGLLSDNASVNAAQSFIAFMEKLYSNPSKKSRDSLYDFIQRHDISILPDGDFIAYKGVNKDGTSMHAGYGIVDGVVFENAHLKNSVGSIVEIPRSKVNTDTKVGCSTGLHAGSYNYATWFLSYYGGTGLLLTVKINPRDVVSVPDHHSFQKIRVSRYVVLSTTEVALQEVFVDFDNDNDWARDEEYDCYECEDAGCIECEDWHDDDDDDFNDDFLNANVNVNTTLNDEANDETPVKVVTNDIDKIIRDVISITFDEDSDENFIKFTYPNSVTGEIKTITGFNIENIAEKSNFAGRVYDALFNGRNQNGDFRSYLYSKMENIEVDGVPLPHIVEADIVTPINRKSPFQVD